MRSKHRRRGRQLETACAVYPVALAFCAGKFGGAKGVPLPAGFSIPPVTAQHDAPAKLILGLSLLAWCVLGLGAYWPRVMIMAASLALAWVFVAYLCRREA
jgi:hypothetical protein